MMMNKRLINAVPESKRYVALSVAAQWVSLVMNLCAMGAIATLLEWLWRQESAQALQAALVLAAALLVRFLCTIMGSRMNFLASREVKQALRTRIYEKLLRLGPAYKQQVRTSEVVQVAVEGVDQLETYFGAYLPQFFYAMLAPVTLFAVLAFVSLPAAVVLLICVPLIPAAIAAVQTWAKKLLSKYWGKYTALGDTFLENLQGLTTLKIYQADAKRHKEMNEAAEDFRKITMKVLTMQLNSITIMDIIAYGGAALGMVMAVTQLRAGAVSLAGCLLILLTAADFFLPMRQLGSFFHIAMNGMAASDKIFRLLDMPEEQGGKLEAKSGNIVLKNVGFAYEADRPILKGANLACEAGKFTALAGESGCGKSTLAELLMGRNHGYTGSVTLGGVELRELSEESLLKTITYVGHADYLFKGTVAENLRMAKPEAADAELWAVLERTNLKGFLMENQGLDTLLTEQGANLSGGQRQRLAFARALLHDSPVYIFDEATSSVDVETENDLTAEMHRLAKEKTVLVISHRLANVAGADCIYALQEGRVAEYGTQQELLAKPGIYARLWTTQQELEQYGKGVRA